MPLISAMGRQRLAHFNELESTLAYTEKKYLKKIVASLDADKNEGKCQSCAL